MATHNSVFVSYRRGIHAWLAQAASFSFHAKGIDVFFNIETLAEAQFETVVIREIEAHPFFMPILAANALNGCIEQNDWYLRALEIALAHGRAIVPLYHSGFDFTELDKFLPISVAHQIKGSLVFELTFVQLMVIADEYLLQFDAQSQLSAAAFIEAKQQVIRQTQTCYGVRLAADPFNADSYVAKALKEARKENWESAITNYTEALRLDPNNAPTYAKRGVMRFMIGDFDGAISDYEETLKLDPNDKDTRNNLVLARRRKDNS